MQRSVSGDLSPGRNDTFRPASGLLALAAVLLLFLVEFRFGGKFPAAAAVAGIALFCLACVLHLETAFALVLAFTPFSVEMLFGGSALQIPTEPMIFIALTAWAMRFLSRSSTRFAQPGFTAVLLLALASCVLSFLGSQYKFLTIKATLNATWYALFGIFILNNYADMTRLRGLVVAWLVPGLILTSYSFFHVLIGHYERSAGYFWGNPFFIDHGAFSAYLSFTFALAAALAIETKGTLKLIFGVAALLLGAQVVLSMTRGAWLGLGAFAIYLTIASWRRLLKPENTLPVAFGLVALVFLVYSTGIIIDIERHSGTITEVRYKSNFERINRWVAGWRMFVSHPLTGIGYGAYQDTYMGYRRFVLRTDESTRRIGTHSEYLRVLAETGIPGVLASLASLFLLARFTRRNLRRVTDPILRGIVVGMSGGLITYLVHAFVNDYIQQDKAAVPVWTAIGVLGAVDTLLSRRDEGVSAPGDR